MVPLVQLVRASDCGSECHGFESHRAPQSPRNIVAGIFCYIPIRPKNTRKRKKHKKKKKSHGVLPKVLNPLDMIDIFAVVNN